MYVHNFAQHLYASMKTYLFAPNFSIEVYSGAIPTDLDVYEAAILANPTAYDAQKLITYTGLNITDQNSHLYIKPYAGIGAATGVATWHVIWSAAGPGTYKLMGDTSIAGGIGLLQLDNVNIVAGNQSMLIDFTIDTAELV